MLFPVDDVGARGGDEVGGDQRLLDDVLDGLDAGRARAVAMGDYLERLLRHRLRGIGAELAAGLAGAGHRGQDLAGVERFAVAVAFEDCRRQPGRAGLR